MGGFHLFERSSEKRSDAQGMSQEDDDPLHPLLPDDLMRDDIYSFTMLTKAEIEDKGKSDCLAKSLVLLQTLWFVIQCIARGIKYLPLTHLEIITLAYAAMNFVIYIFWWYKPLNVNRPVRVFRREPSERRPLVEEPTWELTWQAIGDGLVTILNFIAGNQDRDVRLNREDRVPMFWGNRSNEEVGIADFIMLGVGVCFGAIHCIAWHFSFPTDAELLMWRISCVAITAVPVCISLACFLGAVLIGFFGVVLIGFLGVVLTRVDFGVVRPDRHRYIPFVTFILLLLPALIFYIIARAVTLALAFTSLRGLPHGAYETVHWTTFIPHI